MDIEVEFCFDSHLNKWLCVKYDDIKKIEISPVGKIFRFSEFWIKSLDHYLCDQWGYFDNVLFTILEHDGYEGEIKVCRIEMVI